MIEHSGTAFSGSFRNRLHMEFQHYVRSQAERFDEDECLKIDFHCHDRNSDVPDELWGRLLGLPEMRQVQALATMRVLQPGNRLSITPVDDAEWRAVMALLGT